MSADRILLVEDTASLRLVYTSMLETAGYRVTAAATAQEAYDAFAQSPFPRVVLDLMLPDRSGLELLGDFIEIKPDVFAVAITSHASVNLAVKAIQAGARDFVIKPFEEARLLSILEAGEGAMNQAEWMRSRRFIGSSQAMDAIYARIKSLGQSKASVFITGESGTGKELCAREIHDQSERRDKPFIAVNCGAIPADLLESEMFGHLKGSFTGAISDKVGSALAADGGTLFLDEICELDIALQPKLLRFLETSTVTPVGAVAAKRVNTRIICATNRDPLLEVDAGRFRADLYYRLHVVPIDMPPLRTRGDDVLELADVLLAQFSQEEGKSFKTLADDVRQIFRTHPWPGNVRQLRNVLRNVVVLYDGLLLTSEMLPTHFLEQWQGPLADAANQNQVAALDSLIGRPLKEVEQIVIEATIERFGGSIPRAARVLGLAPSTVYRKRESWVAPQLSEVKQA
ncbi:MAG: sigma-54 dependent transcriptional regulator [Pseudomonadota bacterium]